MGNETELNISLTEAILKLDEVVMIGYGMAKKKDLTGAIVSVSEKDFNKGNFTSPDQLIQGKISGVQMTGFKNFLSLSRKRIIKATQSIYYSLFLMNNWRLIQTWCKIQDIKCGIAIVLDLKYLLEQ